MLEISLVVDISSLTHSQTMTKSGVIFCLDQALTSNIITTVTFPILLKSVTSVPGALRTSCQRSVQRYNILLSDIRGLIIMKNGLNRKGHFSVENKVMCQTVRNRFKEIGLRSRRLEVGTVLCRHHLAQRLNYLKVSIWLDRH